MAKFITYTSDGSSCTFPVPFAFTDPQDLRVSMREPGQPERLLILNEDYAVEGQNIIALIPAGALLVIWLTANAIQTASNAAAKSLSESAAVNAEAAQPDTATIDEKLAASISEIEKWAALATERLRQEMTATLAEAASRLESALSDGLARAANAASAIESRALSLDAEMRAQSEKASRAASTALAATSGISEARTIQENAAITAQGWASASRKSADESHNAACSAWDAATQASIHARRPGVTAVHSIDDIHACSPGLFIINPHLTHAPTPFFGVWPARTVDDMQWDAVFFISPYLYPDDPRLPPRRPPKPDPDPVVATGTGDEWIPCQHSHQSPPDTCACGSGGKA